MRVFVSLLLVGTVLLMGVDTASYLHSVSDRLAATVIGFGEIGTTADGEEQSLTASTTRTISFVGDVMLGRRVEQMMQTYGTEYPFAAFAWPEADYVFANYEAATPEVHVKTPDGGMVFSVSTTSAQSLHSTPITHLSLANNHSYDYGSEGFVHTVQYLESIAMVPFGDQVLREEMNVTSVIVSSTSVAVLGLYALEAVDEPLLRTVLEDMSLLSDVQIVYVHWGEEYRDTHTATQRALAEIMSEYGVELVIGHHPHVVQDIERIGNTLVVYSLGNFVFDQYFSDAVQQGLLVNVMFGTSTLETTLVGVTSEGSRSQPRRMAAYEQEVFLRSLAKRSAPDLASAIIHGRIITPYNDLSND